MRIESHHPSVSTSKNHCILELARLWSFELEISYLARNMHVHSLRATWSDPSIPQVSLFRDEKIELDPVARATPSLTASFHTHEIRTEGIGGLMFGRIVENYLLTAVLLGLSAVAILVLPTRVAGQSGTVTDDAFLSSNATTQLLNLNGQGGSLIVAGATATVGTLHPGATKTYINFQLNSSLPPTTAAGSTWSLRTNRHSGVCTWRPAAARSSRTATPRRR